MKKWNAAKAKRKLDSLWAAIIRDRDKSCQFCGRTEGVMNSHHINSRAHTATRWDVLNGLLLCFHCHFKAHQDIPWGAAKAKQLIGEELYEALYLKSHQIKPFDRIFYEVTLVELKRAGMAANQPS